MSIVQHDEPAQRAAENVERLRAVFPTVAAAGGDETALARRSGLSVEAVAALMADPSVAAQLVQDVENAENDGSLLAPTARRLSLRLLRVVEEAAAAGELDVDDVANLLPKVHRVLEHAETIEVKRSDGRPQLPMVNIVIHTGGISVAEVAPTALEAVQVVERVEEVPALDEAEPEEADHGTLDDVLAGINAGIAGSGPEVA